MRTFERFLLLLCLCFALASCGSKVSKENLERIKAGMTTEEVKAILGAPTDDKSKELPLVGETGMRVWKDGERAITVTFANGKVLTAHGTKL